MVTIEDLPKQYVGEASVNVTERCNFDCSHCLRGQPRSRDLLVNDISLLLDRLENPLLNQLVLTGGEPRMHPQFELVLQTIHAFYESQGVGLYADAKLTDVVLREHAFKIHQPRFNKTHGFSLSDYEYYYKAITNLALIDFRSVCKRDMTVKLYTNGHGMTDTKSAVYILNRLCGMGINEVAISTDLPHRESVDRRRHLVIDYPLIETIAAGLLSTGGAARASLGINHHLTVFQGGVGAYVLPLGKAKDMPWPERIRLARSPFVNNFFSALARSQLEHEFHKWPKIKDYSHCYCAPAYFRREIAKIMTYPPKLRIHRWLIPLINPDLSVNLCLMGILPPLGNLHEMTVQQIYEKAATNKLYKVIASEGPQGLAQKVGKQFPEGLEKAFLDLTPCGMCQSIQETHGHKTAELFSTSSD